MKRRSYQEKVNLSLDAEALPPILQRSPYSREELQAKLVPEELRQTFTKIERQKLVLWLKSQLGPEWGSPDALCNPLLEAIEAGNTAQDYLNNARPIGKSKDWVLHALRPDLPKERKAQLRERYTRGLTARDILPQVSAHPNQAQQTLAKWEEIGRQTRSEFLEANKGLVGRFCVRYVRRWTEFTHQQKRDMLLSLMAGLDQAILLFDFRTGNRFSTYANFWINQAYLEETRQRDGLMVLPQELHNVRSHIWQARDELFAQTGRERFSAKEVHTQLKKMGRDINLAAIERVYEYPQMVWLDAPHHRDDSTSSRHEYFASGAESVEETAGRKIQAADIREILRLDHAVTNILPSQVRVLELRFGLIDGIERKPPEIAKILGFARQRVSKLELDGLQRLREYFERHPREKRKFVLR